MAMVMTKAQEREFTELAQTVLDGAPPPTFEWLAIAAVRVDPEYQRDLSQPRVDALVRTFDQHRFQPIEVSRRDDGTLWCIEGQHRLAAGRQLGMQVIGAMVHRGLTSADEALLFWLFQRDRRALSAWASFKARLHGNEPIAVGIDMACRAAGISYGRGENKEVQAVGALEGVYQLGGSRLLVDTLETIKTIWPLAARRFDGVILGGVGIMLHQFGKSPQFDKDRFVRTLGAVPPVAFIQAMREQRGTGSAGALTSVKTNFAMARVLHEFYNKRLGKARRLPPLIGKNERRIPHA